MATTVTKLPGKIIATDTVPHNLGLTTPGAQYANGGTACIQILSGNLFFSVNADGTLDKNAAASATVGLFPPISFGPQGDIVYQATAIGDSFLISV